MQRKKYKSESSLSYVFTYLTMYDWVVILGVIIIVGLYFGGFFDGFLATTECNANAGFICQSASISTSGYLSATIGQNSGHTIYISDLSCSSKQNANGYPEYGNRYVVPGFDTNGSTFINNMPIFNNGNQNYIKLPSDQFINLTMPCFTSNSSPIMQVGQIFNGTIWINYSDGSSGGYKVQKITSGVIQKAAQNPNFGFGVASLYNDNATVSAPLGYQNYICLIGASYGPIKNNNNNPYEIITGRYDNVTDSEIYTQNSNTCSAHTKSIVGYSNSSMSIAAIGIGSTNYTEYTYYTNNTYGANLATIKYSISKNNSFVVIVAANGYYGLLHNEIIPNNCRPIIESKQIFDGVFAAICTNQNIGNYNATFYSGYNNTRENGALTLAAYVFKGA